MGLPDSFLRSIFPCVIPVCQHSTVETLHFILILIISIFTITGERASAEGVKLPSWVWSDQGWLRCYLCTRPPSSFRLNQGWRRRCPSSQLHRVPPHCTGDSCPMASHWCSFVFVEGALHSGLTITPMNPAYTPPGGHASNAFNVMIIITTIDAFIWRQPSFDHHYNPEYP